MHEIIIALFCLRQRATTFSACFFSLHRVTFCCCSCYVVCQKITIYSKNIDEIRRQRRRNIFCDVAGRIVGFYIIYLVVANYSIHFSFVSLHTHTHILYTNHRVHLFPFFVMFIVVGTWSVEPAMLYGDRLRISYFLCIIKNLMKIITNSGSETKHICN